MWRESVVKIADDMGALACSIVPAHPGFTGWDRTRIQAVISVRPMRWDILLKSCYPVAVAVTLSS